MIKFELIKVGSDQIQFRIVEQSEEIKQYLPFRYLVADCEIIKIDSQCCPDLELNTNQLTVYLRGSEDDKDNLVCRTKFKSQISRDNTFDTIILAFKELSKSWKDKA